jgi:hypothetical protein
MQDKRDTPGTRGGTTPRVPPPKGGWWDTVRGGASLRYLQDPNPKNHSPCFPVSELLPGQPMEGSGMSRRRHPAKGQDVSRWASGRRSPLKPSSRP